MNVSFLNDDTSAYVQVPFLITSEIINSLILGFNAIKQFAKEKDNDQQGLLKLFQKVFSVEIKKVEAFVNLIESPDDKSVLVKVKGKDCIIPPGRIVEPSTNNEDKETKTSLPTEEQQKILFKIDLSSLTLKQKEIVRRIIKEESDVLSVNDKDIGDVKSHTMKINFIDHQPVQLNYNSVPRHLYNE